MNIKQGTLIIVIILFITEDVVAQNSTTKFLTTMTSANLTTTTKLSTTSTRTNLSTSTTTAKLSSSLNPSETTSSTSTKPSTSSTTVSSSTSTSTTKPSILLASILTTSPTSQPTISTTRVSATTLSTPAKPPSSSTSSVSTSTTTTTTHASNSTSTVTSSFTTLTSTMTARQNMEPSLDSNQTGTTIITSSSTSTNPSSTSISTTPGFLTTEEMSTQVHEVSPSGFTTFTIRLFSEEPTNDSTSEKLRGPDKVVVICIAVILSFLATGIVIAAAIFAFIHRRRPDPGPAHERHVSLVPVICSKPWDVHSFVEHVFDMGKNSGLLYADEYMEGLKKVGKHQSCDVADLKCNEGKNRFTNIKPYDVSRVTLLPIDGDDGGSDYINASWMPGHYSRREYISTQGPLPSTKDDFWRMVWEYNCRGIVMLANCCENDKIKCDYYWPMDLNPVVYGDLEVKIISEELSESWNIRDIQISLGQQIKYVKHLHYLRWEDMKVPDPDLLLKFIEIVNQLLANSGGGLRPTIVHCSAGVGRSGTYIALDTLLHVLEDGSVFVDVYGVVYRLRMNRTSMVQMESQYAFLYSCIAHVIKKGANGENNAGYNPVLDESDDSRSIQTFTGSHTTLVCADTN